MICSRCLRRASALLPQTQARSLSYTPILLSGAAQPAPAPPAAISTGLAQPFSTPLTPSPSKVQSDAKTKTKSVVLPVSMCPAGTVLKGLNYLKGRDDPVALPEEEYPSWLWSVLEKKVVEGEGEDGAGDEFSKSAKLRRKAAKRARKIEAMRRASGLEAPEAKVPLTQQSIDLPANEAGTIEGALRAEEKREQLRAAMRRERRKTIKESNFLKGM